MKLTPWFAPTQKPVREGVYERNYKQGIYYSYWDGSKWYVSATDTDTAFLRWKFNLDSGEQNLDWRGIQK